jgi:hypothetical protein
MGVAAVNGSAGGIPAQGTVRNILPGEKYDYEINLKAWPAAGCFITAGM